MGAFACKLAAALSCAIRMASAVKPPAPVAPAAPTAEPVESATSDVEGPLPVELPPSCAAEAAMSKPPRRLRGGGAAEGEELPDAEERPLELRLFDSLLPLCRPRFALRKRGPDLDDDPDEDLFFFRGCLDSGSARRLRGCAATTGVRSAGGLFKILNAPVMCQCREAVPE